MNKQIRNKIAQNEEGSGLVLALMVLLVLSVLGATLGVVTVGSYRLADHTQESNSAYYIAEAGANMAYAEIEEDVNSTYKTSKTPSDFFNSVDELLIIKNGRNYSDFDTQFGSQPTASINVTEGTLVETENKSKEYVIKSIGEVADKERTVEKIVKVTWRSKDTGDKIPSFPENSKLAIIMVNPDKSLFLRNNSTVEGDILHSLENTDYGPGNGKKDEILTGKEFDSKSYNLEPLQSYMNYIFSNLELLNDDENFISENSITINSDVNKNIIIKGDLTIDSKAVINGNVIVEGNVEMNNHSEVYGSIISSGKVEVNNHAKVSYDNSTFSRLPFSSVDNSSEEAETNENKIIESYPASELNE